MVVSCLEGRLEGCLEDMVAREASDREGLEAEEKQKILVMGEVGEPDEGRAALMGLSFSIDARSDSMKQATAA